MKGINAMTTILIALMIVLSIFAWISTDTAVGSGQIEQLQRNSQLLEADRTLEKNILFVKKALGLSVQKASGNASSQAGRLGDTQESKYWICGGNPQPPNLKTVRNTLSELSEKQAQDRVKKLRGKRGNWLHDIGQVTCLSAGYNQPLSSPQNDRFTSYLNLTDLQVQDTEGETLRTRNNIETTEDTIYNRYYYLYSTLKEWTENNELEPKVEKHLKDIPDQKAVANTMCLQNADSCEYPAAFSCEYRHRDWIDEEVDQGVAEELRRLETASSLFNETDVSCSYELNRLETSSYPGANVDADGFGTSANPQPLPKECNGEMVEKEKEVEVPGECKEYEETCNKECDYNQEKDKRVCEKNCYDRCVDRGTKTVTKTVEVCEGEMVPKEKKCGRDFNCKSQWHLNFETYVDMTVTCTDEKFESVPREDLESLKWKFDVSFTAYDGEPSGGQYSCTNRARPPISYSPTELRSCSFSDSPKELCADPGSIKGDLR